MSRRILHIIDSLARTGTSRQLVLLSQGLASGGWDVHIAAVRRVGGPPAAELLSEFAAVRIPLTLLGRRWDLDPLADLQLIRHVRHLRPDIVHTWNTVPGTFAALAVRSGGVPRIIAGHYRIDDCSPAWERFVQRRVAPYVDRFVTNCPTVRDWYIAQGLPAERFIVIPSGVPRSSPSRVDRDALLRKLEVPADARLIGVVGRLVHENRVKDLIWAADLLRVLHDNLRVLIIGDGPLREQLERYARMASDLDHIRFLGERADVGRIMPHLDLLWNARENTGPSLVILEAMAAGVPVVASDTPSNRELIAEGETGYLIPLGSRAGRAARARATDRLFNDSDVYVRLAATARRRVAEQFGAERTIEQYMQLYSVL